MSKIYYIKMKLDDVLNRLFEISPASLAWFMWSVPILGAIFFPIFAIYLVLLIDIYAFYKSLIFNFYFLISYRKINYWNNVNWMEKLHALSSIQKYKEDLNLLLMQLDSSMILNAGIRKDRFISKILTNKLVLKLLVRNQKVFIKDEIGALESVKTDMGFDDIQHVVIIPFWKEGYSVLSETLDYIKNQTYPSEKIIIVLGAEARYALAFELANKLKSDYKKHFKEFYISNHELKGKDIVGKAANVDCAGRMVAGILDENGVDSEKVIFTSCDSDSLFPSQYFAALTYRFLISNNKHKTIFAAPMQYTANYSDLYTYSKVLSIVNSMANVSISSRDHHFMPVSSYSASLRLYKSIDFWSVDVIPEDFHTFMKALFILGDEVRCKPIYLPVLADTADGTNIKDAFINQYEQEKRWAWGTSDHYWMIKNLYKNFSIYKLYRVFNVFHIHYIWGFLGFLLLIGANFITIFNPQLNNLVIANNIGIASSIILTATLLPFITSVLLMYLITETTKESNIIFWIRTLVFWISFPFVTLVMKNMPGLDSQSRLMFGKYMEYRLTDKPK